MPLGIDELTNAPRTIELGGRPYRMSSLILADHGTLQAWIHDRLTADATALARRFAEGQPADVRMELLKHAYDRADEAQKKHMIGTAEADQMLGTLAGFLEILYLMLRTNHPEMTREALAPLVGGLKPDQMGRIMAHAFGLEQAPADVADAGAPDPKAGAGAANANGAALAPSTTSPSSSTSPAGMATPPTWSPG